MQTVRGGGEGTCFCSLINIHLLANKGFSLQVRTAMIVSVKKETAVTKWTPNISFCYRKPTWFQMRSDSI